MGIFTLSTAWLEIDPSNGTRNPPATRGKKALCFCYFRRSSCQLCQKNPAKSHAFWTCMVWALNRGGNPTKSVMYLEMPPWWYCGCRVAVHVQLEIHRKPKKFEDISKQKTDVDISSWTIYPTKVSMVLARSTLCLSVWPLSTTKYISIPYDRFLYPSDVLGSSIATAKRPFSRGFTHHKDLERSLQWRNVFGKFNVRRGLPLVKKEGIRRAPRVSPWAGLSQKLRNLGLRIWRCNNKTKNSGTHGVKRQVVFYFFAPNILLIFSHCTSKHVSLIQRGPLTLQQTTRGNRFDAVSH